MAAPRRLFTCSALCVLFAVFTAPVHAATVTVDDTGDASAADGACTLREALFTTNANAQVGGAGAGDCAAGEAGPAVRDAIVFSLGAGVHTIVPASSLPVISDRLEIDGSQETPALVRIQIDGSAVPATVVAEHGLMVTTGSDGSYLHNLAVYDFPDDGIQLFSDENVAELVIVGMDAEGLAAKGNGGNGITVRGERNQIVRGAISGNGANGVDFEPRFEAAGAENTIVGSRIGTNKAGTAAVPNAGDGIHVGFDTLTADGDDLTIGGPTDPTPGGACDGDCNLISGNGGDGIEVRVSGEGAARTDRLLIQGNYVGTDLAGMAPIPNGGGGVRLFGATAAASIDANLISGNGGDGIVLLAGGPGNIGAADTSIGGNVVGLGGDGDAVVPNQGYGVHLDRSLPNGPALTGTTIGGTADPTPGGACDGDCNLISGNEQTGIVAFDTNAAGSPILDTVIAGNYVGTDSSGMLDRGNSAWGVMLSGVSGTTVGLPGSPNLLSGNGASGVTLIDDTATGNTIQSNLIGVAADGSSPLGNDDHGIEAGFGGAHLNTLGGTAPGTGNTIADNGKAGVTLTGGEDPVVDTPVLGNSIFANGGLGIDLRLEPLDSGVTENGACPEPTGANRCQEFPVVTAATGASAVVAGTLASDPGKTFRVEVFASAAADPSGNGEGERFLGAVQATTDGAGNATWVFADPAATIGDGEAATATATELAGDGSPLSTSEFSDALAAPTCHLQGDGEANTLTGGAAGEVICGLGAGDALSGGGGRDAVLGGEGDDAIDVADGEADALVDCGPGTDTVSADADAIDPAAIFVGCETVNLPAGGGSAPAQPTADPPIDPPDERPTCKGKRATHVGTAAGETIKGTGEADVIVAFGGRDTVKGLGGNDTICGGSGNDTLRGGSGKDRILGEGGNDRLLGEAGDDRLDGGSGKDALQGGSGADRLEGAGGGDDVCDGQGGRDKLDGAKAGCEKPLRL